eukprot:c20618_g1_i2.p1 GENE.c20618_g1_i2~~c20618_g1_i2.p1  ORF type:complete len:189 (+),score=15.33 c20618_g1_i2:176-742(+)
MLLSSMTWFLKRSLLVWLSECLRRRNRGGSEDATIFAARKARVKQVVLLGMTIKNVLCLVFAFVVAIVKAKQAVKYSGLSKWRSYLYYCSIVLNVGVCSSVAATMYEGMLFRAPNRQQVSELQVTPPKKVIGRLMNQAPLLKPMQMPKLWQVSGKATLLRPMVMNHLCLALLCLRRLSELSPCLFSCR